MANEVAPRRGHNNITRLFPKMRILAIKKCFMILYIL